MIFSLYSPCPTPTTDMKCINDQLHMDEHAPANILDAFLYPQNILFVFICTYISMHMYMANISCHYSLAFSASSLACFSQRTQISSSVMLLDVQQHLRPLTDLMGVSCGFKGVFSLARGHLSGESWNMSNEITNTIENTS